MRRVLLAAGAAAVTALAVGCGSSSGSSSSSSSASAASHNQASVTLRLGFLANITHAPALVGLNKGFYPPRAWATGSP